MINPDLSRKDVAGALRPAQKPRRKLFVWLWTTDHRLIAIRYAFTAFGFLFLSGLEGVLLRVQLTTPEKQFLGAGLYNQIFSIHGTTMVFLFAIPIMEAAAVYLVPLMIGARNVVYPRLVASSYWLYLLAGLTLWTAGLLFHKGPDAGWTESPPLSGPLFDSIPHADIWALVAIGAGVAEFAIAVTLVMTVLKARAPGVSLKDVPIFVWAMLVMACVLALATPNVIAASIMLLLDRQFGTHFFDAGYGGEPLRWQYLFWSFGEPAFYAVGIAGGGIASAVISTFAGRPVFGRPLMIASLIALGILSFGPIARHLLTVSHSALNELFFTVLGIAVFIPILMQVFCWIATLWSGGPVYKTALLFIASSIVNLVIAVLSGILLASAPINTQLEKTYFAVAQLHYWLLGVGGFALIGAIYYWFPKFRGRLMDENMGRWDFWLLTIGLHVTFFPMFIMGLQGMPNGIYTYPIDRPWVYVNEISTAGGFIQVFGFAFFLWNFISSFFYGPLAGSNPWRASTLEWIIPSPPPL